MGILNKKSILFICCLCNCSFKSLVPFIAHLQSQHREQMLLSFREFEFGVCKPIKHCCVCKKVDTSLDHLALHSQNILTSMGLIESGNTDHRSSRASCRSCGFVAKNCFKILEHFASAHANLLLFIREKFDAQNEAMEEDIAVSAVTTKPKLVRVSPILPKGQGQISLLKNSMLGNTTKFHYMCDVCPEKISYATNLLALKKHLILDHYYNDILEHVNEMGRILTMCPQCGEDPDGQTINLHYWIHHIVGKGKRFKTFFFGGDWRPAHRFNKSWRGFQFLFCRPAPQFILSWTFLRDSLFCSIRHLQILRSEC